MELTGKSLFEIFNGSDFSGTVIFSMPMLIGASVLFLLLCIGAFVFNMMGSKIANKVINPKTKRVDKSIKLTKADQENIKKFDLMKYVSLGLGVVLLGVGVLLSTNLITSVDKDSDKFKDHFKEVTDVVSAEKGKVTKTGDKIIYKRTLVGKVDGDDFVLATGQKVALKSIEGANKKTTKITVESELTESAKVKVEDKLLTTEGKNTFKAE